MKIKELIKELQHIAKEHPDAECYTVTDPDDIEEGCINGLGEINEASVQLRIIDNGLDFDDQYEILLW